MTIKARINNTTNASYNNQLLTIKSIAKINNSIVITDGSDKTR